MVLILSIGKQGSWESGINLLFDLDGTNPAGGVNRQSWGESLKDPKLWVAAASQVLISLHVSCGLTLTLSSRSRNHGHIIR